MYYIVYTSASRDLFSAKELEELLKVARRNNSRDGITGMLLYSEGVFMQVLEGETKDQVMSVYKRINRDQRHTRVRKLLEGEVETRQFSGWNMGFKHFEGEMNTSIGFSQFMQEDNSGLSEEQKASVAWKLLASFRSNNDG